MKATRRSLAEVLQQDTGITLPPVLTEKLDILEQEIHRQCVSEETIQWLAGCGLSVEKMARQMDPVYTPVRKIHLYHCDHRGLPQALINEDGSTAWQADHDAWGNVLTEKNPHKLSQLIRLPGQQYDEETGLYYNRHRYYDPQLGRYITQDPIGLRGGWNAYGYPLDPLIKIDPLGLSGWADLGSMINSPGIQARVTNSIEDTTQAANPVSLRPDGHPWGDGCGDAKTDKYVPDIINGIDFGKACKAHDKCYGTLGSNKAFCDTELGNNISLACEKQLEGIPHSEEILSSCHMAAGIYQKAVEKFGESAFEAAQKAAKTEAR